MKKKIFKCYSVCPIKYFTDSGKLEKNWVENYCLINNNNCIRYEMEEKGEYHPVNLLPDGKIRKDLEY